MPRHAGAPAGTPGRARCDGLVGDPRRDGTTSAGLPTSSAHTPYRATMRIMPDDVLWGTIALNTYLLRDDEDLSDDDRQMLAWELEAARSELERRWSRGLSYQRSSFGFDAEVIDRIKRAAPVEMVVALHTELRRSGQGYRGPCPIHGGANPTALAVTPGPDGWARCYVCGFRGDAIDFLMGLRRCDFGAALRELAMIGGQPIPIRDRGAVLRQLRQQPRPPARARSASAPTREVVFR